MRKNYAARGSKLNLAVFSKYYSVLLVTICLWCAAVSDVQAQYCAASGNNCSGNDITNVTVEGANSNINNSTGCQAGGYVDYTVLQAYMLVNTTYQASTTSNAGGHVNGQIGIWVDWDGNGSFDDAGENIFTGGNFQVGQEVPIPFTITPPLGTSLGTKRMRVRTTTAAVISSCGMQNNGEVEDYNIIVTDTPPAQGAGYCTASGSGACDSYIEHAAFLTGSFDNVSGCPLTNGYSDYTSIVAEVTAGLSYDLYLAQSVGPIIDYKLASYYMDWNHDSTFTADEAYPVNSGGATTEFFGSMTVPATALSGPTRMRVRIADAALGPLDPCGANGNGEVEDYTINVTNPVVPQPSPSYCDASGPDCSVADNYISNVTVGSINNSSGQCGDGISETSYFDYTALSTTMRIGEASILEITEGGGIPSDVADVWIDWNNNRLFSDAGEHLAMSPSGTDAFTVSITPPANAVVDSVRMRIRVRWGASAETSEPCGTTEYGEVEDYTIIVLSETVCPDPKPTVTYVGPSGTDWSTGSNWSSGSAPTKCDNVIIPNGKSVNITVGPAECHNLTIQSGGELKFSALMPGNPPAPAPNSSPSYSLNVYGNWQVDAGGLYTHISVQTVYLRGTNDTISGAGDYSSAYLNVYDGASYIFNSDAVIRRLRVAGPPDAGVSSNGTLHLKNHHIIVGGQAAGETFANSGFFYQETGILEIRSAFASTMSTTNFIPGIGTTHFHVTANQIPANPGTANGYIFTNPVVFVPGNVTYYDLKIEVDSDAVAQVRSEIGYVSYVNSANKGPVTCHNFELVCIASLGSHLLAGINADLTVKGDVNIGKDTQFQPFGGYTQNDMAISVAGNWINNGFFDNPAPSIQNVTFNGITLQSIEGASVSNFWIMTINNTGPGLILNQHVQDSSACNMVAGNVNLNGYNFGLYSAGTISGETNNNRFYGTSGQIIATGRVPASNMGGMGVTITSPLSNTIDISRGHAVQIVNGKPSATRFYDIISMPDAGLNATLQFGYFNKERNGLDENKFTLFHSNDGGASYTLQDCNGSATVRDTVNNTVQTTAINSFATRWALAEELPTFAGVATPSDQLVCSGSQAQLILKGFGGTIQWQDSSSVQTWTNIAGETNDTLTINPLIETYYRAIVDNTTCVDTANKVRVRTDVKPIGGTASPDQAICDGTTATINLAGSSGTIQWQESTDNTSFTDIAGANGTSVNVTPSITSYYRAVLSNGVCVNDTSTTATITVNPILVPSLTIAANTGSTICSGTNVTFTATPVNGGATPSYQWMINGTNVGANSDTYSDNALNDGDVITCDLTSNATCASPTSATSNSITISVVGSLVPAVSISANPGTSICPGATVTFTANGTYGGVAPTYQWIVNGSNVGTNSDTYSAVLNDGDVISCDMTSDFSCAIPSSASSNTLTITYLPVPVPAVSINSNVGNTICDGDAVIFTATPTNGGTTPSYQWMVNGTNVGTDSDTYISTALADNDVVTCNMTSNAVCATPPTAMSNTITMTVNPILVPSISISANPGNTACAGATITFTASTVNEGTSPVYQWMVNGVNVGTNSNTYSDNTLNDGDVVSCLLTSNAVCVNPANASSNDITMTVISTQPPSVSIFSHQGNEVCDGTEVTFSAIANTAGANPSYQWKVNGGNVGTDADTYVSNTLNDGDLVTCDVTSSTGCAIPPTVTSNTVTMTVNPILVPSVSITSDAGTPNCEGTTIIFTATAVNEGTNPAYLWFVNGLSERTAGNVYTSNTLMDGDVVYCELTSDATCANPTIVNSNTITVSVTPTLATSVFINSDVGTTFCAGTSATFTASPTNGGATPSYQWQVNGSNVGANSDTYTTNTLVDGDQVTCIMTSNAVCPNPATVVSNTLTITVPPTLAPSVVISENPGTTVCDGTTVTFTASPTNGGTSPSYQWQVNGSNVGTDSDTYTTNTLVDADQVTCIMTSNEACPSPASATSNTLTITVPPTLVPSVNIVANPGNAVCLGTSVAFIATPTNGGTSPSYQWQVNGTNVGTNSDTYNTSSLADGDQVTCVMTSNEACPMPSTVTSAAITMTIYPIPVATINANGPTSFCDGGSVILTASDNGNPANTYVWSTGETDASISVNTAGAFTVTITNSGNCLGSASQSIVIYSLPQAVITPNGPTLLCGGANVMLTASDNGNAANAYMWSTGETTADITVSSANAYSVTVTNSNNCIDMTSIAVTENGLAASINAVHAGCAANDGEATVTANGGSGNYTYLWNNAATTQTISALVEGTYTVTVNDGNCIETTSVTITAPAAYSFAVTPQHTICADNNGAANVVITGGTTPYGYLWSTGETTQSIQNLAPGNYTVTLTASGCDKTASVTINASTAVQLMPITTHAGCDNNDGSITITATGGNGAYTYLWNTNATTSQVSSLSAGGYSVTVTDGIGCSAILSQSITAKPVPVASIIAGGPVTFCSGDNVILTASGGVSYLWNTGETTDIINATTTQTYTVVVTNSVGCTASAVQEVMVNDLPVASVTTNRSPNLCTGESISLTAQGGATYKWNTGATAQTITVNTANTYKVTVTNANDCFAVASQEVTVNPYPTAMITAGGATSFCEGGNVKLTASGGVSYLWSTGVTTSMITANTSGTYTVTVTSNAGCSDTEEKIVTVYPLPEAKITANGPTAFCNGQSVTLTASGGATYLWHTGSTKSSITVNSTTLCTVTVYNADGCVDIASVDVSSDGIKPTISANGATVFCDGDSVELIADGGFNYLWSNGSTTAGIKVFDGGTYTVTVSSSASCTATKSVKVTKINNPDATITVNGSTTICQGESLILNGTAGAKYLWSTGETTGSIEVSTTGSFSVTVSNANGCTTASETIKTTVVPRPSKPTISVSGNMLTSSTANTYQWLLNGQPISGATQQNHFATSIGFYKVIISDINGCKNVSDSVHITTVTISENVARSIYAVNAYPNPFNNELTVKYYLGAADELSIELTDIAGRLIATPLNRSIMSIGEHEIKINADDYGLRQGLYLIKLSTKQGNYLLRVNHIENQ